MATIYRRKESPIYYAAYMRADGSRVYKSTGAKTKQEARAVAADWEKEERKAKKANIALQPEISDLIAKAGQDANRGTLTLDKARSYLTQLYRISNGEEFPHYTIAEWLTEWLHRTESQVGKSTYNRYKNSIDSVIKLLGDAGAKRLELLTTQDLENVKTKLRKLTVKTNTKNYKLQDFKSAIKEAHAQGLIERDFGLSVKLFPVEDNTLKTPFTPLEVEQLLAEAKGEWKGVILIGAHTGLRLTNITKLKWEEVDLPRNRFVLKPVKQKKGRRDVIPVPMSHSIKDYFKNLQLKTTGYVFEDLAHKATSTHSTNFARLMNAAEIPKAIPLAGGELGERTFHSLRHFFVSCLANADISADVRKSLSAHKSDSSHNIYTHHDHDTLQSAVDILPAFKAI